MSVLQPVRNVLKAARQWGRYQMLPQARPRDGAAPLTAATCAISAADPGGLGDAFMTRTLADRYGADGLDITCWDTSVAGTYPGSRAKVDVDLLRGRQAESVLRQYGRLACIGADVMDGLYAYADSCLRLRLLSLAAAMGLESRLFGFSFNATPHPRTRVEFKALHEDVIVCVRDPISFERLKSVVEREPRLVADLAFLVEPEDPGPSARPLLDWVDAQRRDGRQVIGLNLHPMFSFDHGPGITSALVASLTELVERSPGQSFVLIPHDFRPVFGDLPTLQTLAAGLSAASAGRVRLVDDLRDPAALKWFVGHLDGIFTGRMHLAIAAMGQGVPVAGITYQGKFEGLLQHFMLEGLTIAPPDAADPARLARFFGTWLAQLDHEGRSIRANLPRVIELSRLNFT